MLKVGLTGGVASGKSTVAELFQAKGIPVLDADNIVHELLAPEQAGYQAIVQRWGEHFLTSQGEIDRQQLRQWVFDHPEDRQWLEDILHPWVRYSLERRAERCETPYCVMVIPLLAESQPAQELVDIIVVVDTEEQRQIERLCERDRVTEKHARNILAAQTDRQTRLASADEIIENIDGIEELKDQVDKLHQKFWQRGSE